MPEPHDRTAIRTTRQTIEAQLMAGTYCAAVDDTEATNKSAQVFAGPSDPRVYAEIGRVSTGHTTLLPTDHSTDSVRCSQGYPQG